MSTQGETCLTVTCRSLANCAYRAMLAHMGSLNGRLACHNSNVRGVGVCDAEVQCGGKNVGFRRQ